MSVDSLPINSNNIEESRDNSWLIQRLNTIRKVHFADVAQGYPIVIKFGIRARYRFGSIAARNGKTIILINQLFADPSVPDYVIDSTIGHELAHYAHGYGSGLPRLHANPHRGGVVDRELEERGMRDAVLRSEAWRKVYWEPLYNSRCVDLGAKKNVKSEADSEKWRRVLECPAARSEEELRRILHGVHKRLGTPAGTPVFDVGWLMATTRQAGASYWFPASGTVRLHGLLANKRVPTAILEFELAYWVVRRAIGSGWPAIEFYLRRAGMGQTVEEAIRWRRASWTSFRKRHHPLLVKA